MNNKHPESTEQQAPWAAMIGLLGGRLIALSGFLIFLSFIFKKDGLAVYAFIAFAYIITIPYSLWMRNQDRMRQLAPLQFLVDLTLVSGLIYFTGGQELDFMTLLYPLIILSAGIILPLKQTLQITALSIVSYALITLLMSQHILVAYPSGEASNEPGPPVAAMLLRIGIFILFGIASAYVSKRCNYIHQKEKQLRDICQLIFENVKTGLLLLDADDRIIMANHRACTLLGRTEPELLHQNFDTIRLPPAETENTETDLLGASTYFRRTDGSAFPVSIEESRLTLPSEAIPQAQATANSGVDTRILNFDDISHFLRLQNQARQVERMKAAATMAKEMAHQIRTPLTGISGFTQLLLLNMKNPEGITAEKERDEYCDQIIKESSRMDKVIQNFLDYTEFSPEKTRELFQLDLDTSETSH